jgi:hypothetical protein
MQGEGIAAVLWLPIPDQPIRDEMDKKGKEKNTYLNILEVGRVAARSLGARKAGPVEGEVCW